MTKLIVDFCNFVNVHKSDLCVLFEDDDFHVRITQGLIAQ